MGRADGRKEGAWDSGGPARLAPCRRAPAGAGFGGPQTWVAEAAGPEPDAL
eukprot:CAMPEP_0117671936 /NCGR_PEP_ID=MMETSP0804-20121206/13626_1 /TAXON_ID=1074897 /ORGANISM="Tetraselmis astigmatica, Strain CCMP880" /LENGTH=50 /DNA_ID=CAMNT_0005480483 /DNA_START=54 /DNA_END=203 /DNA_ORIENTATION=-